MFSMWINKMHLFNAVPNPKIIRPNPNTADLNRGHRNTCSIMDLLEITARMKRNSYTYDLYSISHVIWSIAASVQKDTSWTFEEWWNSVRATDLHSVRTLITALTPSNHGTEGGWAGGCSNLCCSHSSNVLLLLTFTFFSYRWILSVTVHWWLVFSALFSTFMHNNEGRIVKNRCDWAGWISGTDRW